MDGFFISKEDRDGFIKYLILRPYQEVARAIQVLQTLQPVAKPSPTEGDKGKKESN
jgi:hypothetical protein